MGFWDGSGISWTICKQSAHRSRYITTSTPHHSIFTGRMLFPMPNKQCPKHWRQTEGTTWKTVFKLVVSNPTILWALQPSYCLSKTNPCNQSTTENSAVEMMRKNNGKVGKPRTEWKSSKIAQLNNAGVESRGVNTHAHLTALCPGLPRWTCTRKVKPIWILLKQETVSGTGINWAVCKSAPRSRQITMPAPHHSSVLQAGCRPTNSVKALNESIWGWKCRSTVQFITSNKKQHYLKFYRNRWNE